MVALPSASASSRPSTVPAAGVWCVKGDGVSMVQWYRVVVGAAPQNLRARPSRAASANTSTGSSHCSQA